MNVITRNLLRIVTGDTTPDVPKPPIDLNPDAPEWRKVKRVVRESAHIGTAFGGDLVLIDERELAHPPVAHVLLTEEEHAEVTRRQAKRLIDFIGGGQGPSA